MIPVARPDISEAEIEQVSDSLRSGWIGKGSKVDEFESAFGDQFRHEHVMATNAGTSALDLALKGLDTDGTEVLVPPITWISTAFVALYNGFDLGWVDILEATLNMDPDDLADRISNDTAAVIPVHYGGQPAEIDEIVEIASRHDAAVIEDCAHAVGTTFCGQPIGSFGDVGCFSFQATKPMTTGEGGAVVTADETIASRIRRMSKLGVDKSTHERSEEDGYDWYYEVTNLGYKYFMNDIAAGMGLAQLKRFSELQSGRRDVADAYAEAFADEDWIEPLERKNHATHAWYNYTISVPSEHRDDLVRFLDQRDVGASVHYMPLYKHPVFDDQDPDLPATEQVWERLVTLPMSSTFTENQVASVIDAVLAYGRQVSQV